MPLSARTRLGPYEIVAPLGAGGMGEVYRARDTKLGRAVALKILPESFTHDPERLARFRREAQVLAALNHPHIGAIYGLDEANGTQFLVLELVDGESLDKRIARGPIPVDEALGIARQIAEALEAAHEKGIIHRDLKPANIALTRDGNAKVLDFGLAKATEAASGASIDLASSPTLTSPAMMTGVGMILGTAAYMSPEQAKGRAADKRSDVWAFGCVLYEMLTGKRAFHCDDVSDTLVSIFRDDPKWAALPRDTPVPIRRLLRRCLEKDRKRRFDSVADAQLEIDDALSPPTTEMPAVAVALPGRVASIALTALAGSLIIAAFVIWVFLRPAPGVALLPSRFTIVPPPEHPLAVRGADRDLALSPNGRHLVYRAGASGPVDNPLMVRAIDQLDAQLLAGIKSARGPFFSPDSRWIGFFDGAEIKKVSITGGPPVTVCRFSGLPRGASWADDNTIVFATNDPTTGLWRVSAGGGEPTVLTTPDASQHEGDHIFPSVLPGDRGVLFTIVQQGQPDNAQVVVLDLKNGRRKMLIRGGSDAEYVASGHLIYAAAGTLRAARFDLAKLDVLSDPVPIVDHVMVGSGGAINYAVSRSGTLVYVPSGAGLQVARSLVWVDRKGRETPINAPPRAYAAARLSPDGMRIALDIRDQENDLWIWDLARETLTRLTVDPSVDQAMVWTPDGRWIIFASSRSGVQNLYTQATDGTGTVERLTPSANPQFPTSITPDGTRVIGFEIASKTGFDVVLFPLASAASQSGTGRSPGAGPSGASPLIQTTFNESNAEVSPDGRFLAYQSDESGRPEIYVRPFPQVNAGRWLVSTGGGLFPRWRGDGRELFYLDQQARTLMAVPVQASAATFSAGTPGKVFDMQYAAAVNYRAYDVSHDGQRFLMIKDSTTTGDRNSTPAMVVVLNWFEELKARVPTK